MADTENWAQLWSVTVFLSQLFPSLQWLKAKEKPEGDVNVEFKKLLSELNKPDAPYALSVANRLYGEQTYNFLQVRVW